VQLIEIEQLGTRLLRVLWRVLQSRYPAVDCAELGRRCQLTEQWWQHYSANPLADALILLQELRRSEAPEIALELGDLAQLSDLGLLGYAMLTSPSCEQATMISCHAFSEVSFLVQVQLETGPEQSRVFFHLTDNALPIQALLMELCSVAAWRYIQAILPEGRAAVPDRLELSISAPAHHSRYREMLGCDVIFDAPRNVIMLPTAWLKRRIPSGNEQAAADCARQVQRLLGESYRSASIVQRVKRLLMSRPHDTAFQLDNTAQLLNMSPRSLRRHLENAGVNFRRLCLEVRMELAKEYLTSTGLSLKEIAFQLGYTHPNNFNRAFSDYYAVSPRRMRQNSGREEPVAPANQAGAPRR
tara:strand:+ start:26351 stop:27421 length:1071 start_codon:yes stop_codon:yes gene_type:complete